MSEKTEKKKGTPEIYMMPKKDGLVKFAIRNAGIAGKILQFRMNKGTVEFNRVVPPNQFAGVYNDPAIEKSYGLAVDNKKNAFISNSMLVEKDFAESIAKEVQKIFPEIWKLVQAKQHKIKKVRKEYSRAARPRKNGKSTKMNLKL